MKTILLVFLSIMMSDLAGISRTPSSAGKEKKYPSFYKEGVVVDGVSREWENTLFMFNSASKVAYAIVNDSVALYICIRVANEPEQMKIVRNGMDLIFNSQGKKKAEADLHYPVGGGRMNEHLGPGNQNMGIQTDRKRIHMMMLLQMQDMELTGFREGVNGFQHYKSGRNGITAAVTWDSTNTMVYEARIPFMVFRGDITLSAPLSFGIMIKGTPKPKEGETDKMNEGGQEGMQGHGGGMRPGSNLGHEQGMLGSNDTNQFEDDVIWRMMMIAKKE